MYPLRAFCTQVVGTLASDIILKQTEQGYNASHPAGVHGQLSQKLEIRPPSMGKWVVDTICTHPIVAAIAVERRADSIYFYHYLIYIA